MLSSSVSGQGKGMTVFISCRPPAAAVAATQLLPGRLAVFTTQPTPYRLHKGKLLERPTDITPPTPPSDGDDHAGTEVA